MEAVHTLCETANFGHGRSIKHLREASQTDGKAARSLHKLTLFRQFYVLVVTYIYFTRIVVSRL